MLAESKSVLTGKSLPGHASNVVVYEGFLTQLIVQQLNLSVPYYTSVKNALTNMGCIRQLRRGGGSSPSQWEMITEPTVEAFMAQRPPKQPKQDKYSMMQEQINNLSIQVAELTDMVQEMVQAWAREFGTKEVKE